MIFVGYACLVIALTAYLRGSIDPVPQRYELPLRALGVLVGVGLASIGLVLLGNEGATTLGNVALLLLAFGGVLYAWGLTRWRSPDGLVSRRVGWILVVAALTIPSTLTLLLPLACLLLPTLRPSVRPLETARISPLGQERLDAESERTGRDALHEAENRLR